MAAVIFINPMDETPEPSVINQPKPGEVKRSRVSWSNFTDVVEGPCVVCGVNVRYVIPSDRPTPAILFHPTCDVMPVLRERLKAATPPPLPPDDTIRFKSA